MKTTRPSLCVPSVSAVKHAPVAVLAIAVAMSATGCVRPGRQPEVRWLALTETEALVEAEFELEDRRREEKRTGTTVRTQDWLLRETARVNAEGYVYHPRFLEFAAALGVALDQGHDLIATETDVMAEERADSRTGESPEYDIEGTLLGQHPASLSFGVRRSRTSVRPAFAGVSVVNAWGENVELNVKHDLFPTRLYASHAKTQERQVGVGEDRDDETALAGITVTYAGDRTDAEFTYQFEDRTERIFSEEGLITDFDLDRRTHEASLHHTRRFGPGDVHRLTSTIEARDETGTYPSRHLSINEQLTLEHSRHLSSRYGLLYARDAIGGGATDSLAGTLGLTHRLYESLVTDLELNAQREQFDGSSRDDYGARLNLDYRKRIPHGTLFITAGGGYTLTDEKGGVTIVPVRGERHVLKGAATVFLARANVLVGTIVVSNEDRSRTFLPDVDYQASVRGERVELRRLAAGGIPSGGAVLVDYFFTTDGDLAFATRTLLGRVQVDLFEFLSLYASRQSIANDVLSGFDAGRLENLDDTLLGASVDWGPFTLTGEVEDYDSSLVPYRSYQVSLDARQRLGEIHTLSGNALWRRQVFGEGGEARLASLTASYEVTPKDWPSLSVSAGYERSRDRGFAETAAFADLEIHYRIRSTEMAFEYKVTNRDDTFARELSHYVFLSIRRSF